MIAVKCVSLAAQQLNIILSWQNQEDLKNYSHKDINNPKVISSQPAKLKLSFINNNVTAEIGVAPRKRRAQKQLKP